MLFRPHKQIKLGGFVVPFTPGLIPKEKQELARKVGEVLGESVLTKEALVEAATDDGVIENITKTMSKFLEGFLTDERNLLQIASQTFNITQDELMARAAAQGNGIIDHVAQNFGREWLQNLGRGKAVGDVLPSGFAMAAKNFAKERIADAPELLEKLLEHPKWGEFLRQTATKIIKENSGGLMGMFINPDKIYNSLTGNLKEYLKSDEGQTALHEHLDKFFDWMLAQSLDDVPQAVRDWIADALETLAQRVKQDGYADKAASAILNLRPAQVVPGAAREKAAGLVRPAMLFLVDKAGEMVVGSLDIPRIVQKKINELDTAEMEKLLLSVVGKQLKWIAALGGVLGFIIGFIPVILA